jgi:hypothetical protein
LVLVIDVEARPQQRASHETLALHQASVAEQQAGGAAVFIPPILFVLHVLPRFLLLSAFYVYLPAFIFSFIIPSFNIFCFSL